MVDVVSAKTRSRMMSGIRGKDTKPEMLVRKALHSKGFRYRLHYKKLPGKPDLVLPKYKAAIEIHGCFWHKHDCHLFKWPSSRQDFWTTKLNRNAENDRKNKEALLSSGWRLLVIWECSLKGKFRLNIQEVIERTVSWLYSDKPYHEIQGTI